MQNVCIQYQPFRRLKFTREINGSFPSSFSELNPSQLIAIAGLINQTISDTDFLNSLTGIRKFWIKRLSGYELYQLMLLFDPFTSIEPYNTFIIPNINCCSTVLVSPKPKLAGVTLGQFIYADSYFTNYQTDKKPLDLYKFVASLYLPQFRSFNENDISAGELYFGKVKPEILQAVVINYVLVKEWLGKVYPLVFESDEESPGKKSLKKANTDTGWIKVYENIVGDDIINHERYSSLPVNNVFRWMSAKIKERMKQK